MHQLGVIQLVQVLDTESFLRLGHAGISQLNRLAFDVDLIVFVRLQRFDEAVRLQIQVGRLLLAAGDDQRRPRFVDQDRVDFIDQREIQRAQDAVLNAGDHVVAQIVESDFRVGRVGDIAVIRRALLRRGELTQVQADRQAQEAVNLPHPVGVTAGQVFVDGDDVHAAAVQRVQIDRQYGG